MFRCYSEKSRAENPTYVGCTVCREWHNFQNFAKWYDDNYPSDGHEYHLDKDILIDGNKEYSPVACMFVTRAENNIKAHAKSFKLISPTGELVEVYNLAKFCRDNGLWDSGIHSVVNGRQESHKGWRIA